MSDIQNPEIEALRPITSRVNRAKTAIKTADGSSRWTDEPLTIARMAKHLNGGPARGVCPIEQGANVTSLAALDLDSHKGETTWPEMAAVARRLMDVLEAAGIHVTPFRSSGGKGIHLIPIWDKPQDAYSVRVALDQCLAAIGFTNGCGGVKNKEIEIFPKQDSVPLNGYGNQFILPLAGKSVPLDPTTLEPLPREAVLTLSWPVSEPVPVLAKPVKAPRSPDDLPIALAPLRSALAAIPNEPDTALEYDAWRNIVFAIHYETDGDADGLALATEFSERSGKHDAEFFESRVWPYIDSNRDNPITGRSILHLARQHGWSEDVSDEFDDCSAAADETPAANPGRFNPIQAAVFAVLRPSEYLVKGVLAAGDLAVMYGASGSGKTFMALDIACAIALGLAWRGHRVKQGRVAYICAEGASGFRKRLLAYAHQHQIRLDDLPLDVIAASPNLLKGQDVKDLIAALKGRGYVLVVVDTLAQTTIGGDENSSTDMGKALAHCNSLSHALDAAVLLIHHSGKDSSKGARGSSAIRAAVGTEIEILRAENQRAMSVTKQKDGEEGQDFGFRLLTVTLGIDEEGDPIESCVVEHTEGTAKAVRKAGKAMGSHEITVWNALLDATTPGQTGVRVEDLIMKAIEATPEPGEGKRDRRRDLCKRALEELVKTNKVSVVDGFVLVTEVDDD